MGATHPPIDKRSQPGNPIGIDIQVNYASDIPAFIPTAIYRRNSAVDSSNLVELQHRTAQNDCADSSLKRRPRKMTRSIRPTSTASVPLANIAVSSGLSFDLSA
jgi:hypothetical protein